MSDRPDRPTSGTVRLGALTIALIADEGTWAETFALRFRCALEPGRARHPDIILRVDSIGERVPAPSELGSSLEVERKGSTIRYGSGVMDLTADVATSPVDVLVTVRPTGQWTPHLHRFFAVHLDALLLTLGAIRLHGAAIEFGGATNIFLGDKGAGKSTMSLALGLAGGRVLADDQLLARRTDRGIRISGVDGNVRLTAKTESHFLTEPLDAEPLDYGGFLKKEVPLGGIVTSIPHAELPPRRLFFSRVGRGFEVTPISKRNAASRIINELAQRHTFADASDRLALLALVGDLVAEVETADLELSPDLRELDRLADHLAP